MAETSIVFPDHSLIERLEALIPRLGLPRSAEFRIEPALDYPGQQVAIDLFASTDDELRLAVEAVRDAVFHEFRIAVRTSDELDRESLAHQAVSA